MSDSDFEFVAFGDTQFNPWQEGAMPELWERMAGVFDRVSEYARNRGIDNMVFLGDLFEHKSKPRMDIVSTVYQRWMMAEKPANTFLMAGNHDHYNGKYSVDLLLDWRDPGMRVIKKNLLSVHQERVLFLPNRPEDDVLPSRVYDDKLKCFPQFPLLFSHGELELRPMSPSRNATRSPDLLMNSYVFDFHLVVNGHYHNYEKFTHDWGENNRKTVFCNVGSPFAFHWGDVDCPPRGFVHGKINLDTPEKSIKIKHVPLTMYPRFYSQPGNYEDHDFVAPESKVKTKTKLRQGTKEIADRDMTKSLAAYVDHALPDAPVKKRERVLKKGMSISKS